MDYAKPNDGKVSRCKDSSRFKEILERMQHTIFAHKYSSKERIHFS